MTLRDEIAAAIATVSRCDTDQAWVYIDEADAVIDALHEHLARQPEDDGSDPAATIGHLRARLALAEARVATLEAFRAQDEAAEREFYDRVEKLVHGCGTVEATMARLRSAAEEAASAIWCLACRVEELERGRGGEPRGARMPPARSDRLSDQVETSTD